MLGAEAEADSEAGRTAAGPAMPGQDTCIAASELFLGAEFWETGLKA